MNQCILIGRLTSDPEIRRSQNGKAYCSFTLAVDRPRKAPGQPDADFIRCKCFGKMAENLGQYQHKGSKLAVEGSIQTGSYVNRQGQKVYTTDIMANQIDYLDSAKRQSGYQPDPSAGYYPPMPEIQESPSGSEWPASKEEEKPEEYEYNYRFPVDGSDGLPF